ncbi:reverse transcriptase domain-containing protein [Tanacetum coccineum]
MNTRARKEEKAPCSRDTEAEDGVHPRTPIAVRKAQGIQKITLKAKIVKVGTGSLNYEEKSPVSKMMIFLSLGHVKTYNGSEDPEDHMKIFQAATKTERWAMPTWCHMFNSTLTGNARVWFNDLPPESIDSYNDLREAFLKNYLQQKKCIRDPIVLHNIKQRDEESTEDFTQRYKSESGNVKGASGKRRPQIKKGKKSLRPEDTKKGVIDECNHLRKQIEDMLKEGKLSHIIQELKQSNGKEQPKKKCETSEKEKPQAILMIQSRQKAVRQKITQSFSPNLENIIHVPGER